MKKTKKNTSIDKLVKQWIDVDQQYYDIAVQYDTIRKSKQRITDQLVKHMKTNHVGGVSSGHGELVLKPMKYKHPMSKKFLREQLQRYYASDPTTANNIATQIFSNREEFIRDILYFCGK